MAADDSELRLRIREITETRVHYGYSRVYVILRREGWRDNHKRIYRLYSEQGLSLRLKCPRRNKSAQRRQPQHQGLYPNHVWGMDFVSDALFDGRRLRLLTIIDLYTRECLGICVGQNLRSTEVAEMLNTIALRRPLPTRRIGRENIRNSIANIVACCRLMHMAVMTGCTMQNVKVVR
ncbi:UNVERIFIED_ORG: transposase InsO family protein [Pantoea agglomerans]